MRGRSIAVRIANSFGLWSRWTEISINVLNSPGPAVTAEAETANSVTLKWTGSGYDFFLVYRDGVPIEKTAGLSFTDLHAAGKHKYYVRGCCSDSSNYGKSNVLATDCRPEHIVMKGLKENDFFELKLSDEQRQYSDSDPRRMPMAAEFKKSTDIFSAPNVFVCTCSSPDRDGVLTATAENNSPASQKSVVNRGMRICKYVKVPDIADQNALQTYAERLRDESLLSSESLKLSVPAEAGHGPGDIAAVDRSGVAGVYIEKGWRLKMRPGSFMDLNLQRTVL